MGASWAVEQPFGVECSKNRKLAVMTKGGVALFWGRPKPPESLARSQ
jgi:hypothetical protein